MQNAIKDTEQKSYTTLDKCVACGGSNLEQFLDLAKQPLANNYHDGSGAGDSYQLGLNLCTDCYHTQLPVSVDPKAMFDHYLYVTGTSQTLRDYCDWFAEFVDAREDIDHGNILDIACNDGTQLDSFRKLGWKTFGVDPAKNLFEIALEKGLFPHTNAGNLNFDEMRELKKTNVSMGLMLENISERLTEKGMPHYLAASKRPKARLEILENSGKLRIPMTTGILVGIGETIEEIIDSLLAIKGLHQKYGNIQEVILQNFQPKQDTRMKDEPSADEKYFKTIVAISRIMMPEMNIQIPPNLSPRSYQSFLSVGINDWGGISPLTPDFVNPEFSWPEINKVDENSKKAGFDLKCRFPIYPEFFSFISKELQDKMKEIQNEEGLVKEEYWR